MAQVQQVRIPFGVVGVLMVGHVEDAVEMDRREDWKHAEEVGNEIIKEAMLHECVMRGFMAQAGQAMLEHPPISVIATRKTGKFQNQETPQPDRNSANRIDPPMMAARQLYSRQAEQVRKAIDFPQSHDLMLELRIVKRRPAGT